MKKIPLGIRKQYVFFTNLTRCVRLFLLLLPAMALSQHLSVSGKVTDKEDMPIAGVHIMSFNTKKGVVSDFDGTYNIEVTSDDRLVYSAIGFKTQTIAINNRNQINVQMQEDITQLGTVMINAGYYSVKEREQTGNISRITSKEIETQPVANPLAALQGRMPGVYIQQQSGVAGGGFSVRIRGQNSISSGNDPLYVIDGVPFISESLATSSRSVISNASPLSNLNPSDIASIEVLKDADATAIYGSRGANGVVLISTKKGNIGKTKVDIQVQNGIGKVANRVDLLNTDQYLEMRQEAFGNDGVQPNAFNAPDLISWDSSRQVNWQDEFFGKTSYNNNVQLSISGGQDLTQFSIRGGYYNETSVYPGAFNYKKYTVNTTIQHQSENNRFKVSFSSMVSKEANKLPRTDLAPEAILLPPNTPELVNEDGSLLFYEGITNPYAFIYQTITADTKSFNGNLMLSYKVVPDLTAKVSLGYNTMAREDLQLTPANSINPASTSLPASEQGNATTDSWIIEPQLEYIKRFDKSTINVLLGTTFQQTQRETTLIEASGFNNDALLENLAGAPQISISQFDYSKYKYNALFGRINYAYDGKYFINLTGRRDGSSRFGPGNQFANFGALGVSWILSSEPFIQQALPFLSHGKLRGSYGYTGNDQIGDYQYLNTYSSTPFPFQGASGLYPTRLFNPNFAWEKNRKFEAALELGVFKDRFFVGASYYNNRSDNQLVGLPLPTSTGFSNINANLGALVENKGWEFELDLIPIQRNHFTWQTAFNISFPKNTLLDYPSLESSTQANYYEIGRSLFIQRKLHVLGVDTQTGLLEFEDVNSDNQVTIPVDYKAIYELTQQYYGGFQNNLNYKNWELDVFFQFVKQDGIRYTHFSPPGFMKNQPVYVMNRWQSNGNITNVQRFTQSGDASAVYSDAQNTSDYIYGDTSFIRLKNIALSYTIPTKNAPLKKARVYVQGQNLLTITNYKGLDPETSVVGLPPLQQFVLGLQVTF